MAKYTKKDLIFNKRDQGARFDIYENELLACLTGDQADADPSSIDFSKIQTGVQKTNLVETKDLIKYDGTKEELVEYLREHGIVQEENAEKHELNVRYTDL